MAESSNQYKATGIILKGKTFKETDRLVTVLTADYGLITALAPGAKKHKSRLRGRTELFVINELLIVKGRSLDKIIQAETIYTFPGLSKDLGRLAAAQYLGELATYIAVDQQPQADLYELLSEHLRRIERLPPQINIYPYIVQGVFHLLAIAGIAPQVHACSLTNTKINLEEISHTWRCGFSFDNGGIVLFDRKINKQETIDEDSNEQPTVIQYKLNPLEVGLLQHLSHDSLPNLYQVIPSHLLAQLSIDSAWIRIEKILRQYVQHYLGKSIRSADLVDKLYLVEF